MKKVINKIIQESDSIIQTKKHIDNMSYRAMLSLNRFAPIGHPYFYDEIGTYFLKVMNEKEQKLTPRQAIRISKDIGWR